MTPSPRQRLDASTHRRYLTFSGTPGLSAVHVRKWRRGGAAAVRHQILQGFVCDAGRGCRNEGVRLDFLPGPTPARHRDHCVVISA